jgi:hypothetical protein
MIGMSLKGASLDLNSFRNLAVLVSFSRSHLLTSNTIPFPFLERGKYIQVLLGDTFSASISSKQTSACLCSTVALITEKNSDLPALAFDGFRLYQLK